MTTRFRMAVAAPAAALALALGLALTGCGKVGAQPGSGVVDSTGGGSASTQAPAATSAADDSGLDGISQDLDSAGAANTEAGSNAQSGDQAAASSDEP